MEQNPEWNELETLIASDPAARALALGMEADEPAALERLRAMRAFDDPRYTAADIGNSNLFADFYRDTLRYAVERKRWYYYDGAVWHEDTGDIRAAALVKQLVRLLEKLAAELADAEQHKAVWKRLSRLYALRARQDLIRDARTVHTIAMNEFDADPWLLNCLNGTLDLRTQIFHAHRADDLLTHMATVFYNPLAVCPRWERFVEEVTAIPEQTQLSLTDGQPDPSGEKLAFLQKALGYALTGDTSRECMFILCGTTTRNGKSTLLETIARMLGDYAAFVRPESLAARRGENGGSPNEDIARLHGKRLVTVSEPENNHQFNASLIKRLTGNDTITARFLHENSFEFRPQFKIFMNTNYRPFVSDQTLFRSGRIKLIPFDRHFAEGEQDQNLKRYFAQPDHLSAVLNWCLQGLRSLQLEGLQEPECIRAAIDRYRNESDWLSQFMQDCLLPDDKARVRIKQVYAAYADWCRQNGFVQVNSIVFRRLLGERAQIKKMRPDSYENALMVLNQYRLKSDH